MPSTETSPPTTAADVCVSAGPHSGAIAELSPAGASVPIPKREFDRAMNRLPSALQYELGARGLSFAAFLREFAADSAAHPYWSSLLADHQRGNAAFNTITIAGAGDASAEPVDYADRPMNLRWRTDHDGHAGRLEMYLPGQMNTDKSSLLADSEWWVALHPDDLFEGADGEQLKQRVRANGMRATAMPAEGMLRSGLAYGSDCNSTPARVGSPASDLNADVIALPAESPCMSIPMDCYRCCVGTALLNSGAVRPHQRDQLMTMIRSRHPKIASIAPNALENVIGEFVGASEKLTIKFDSSIKSHHHILPCACSS